MTLIAASGYAPPVGSIVICRHSLFAPTGRICALGKVSSKRIVSTARVRSRIQPLYLLEDPIDCDELERMVAQRSDHHVTRALLEGINSFDLYPKQFTERSSLVIVEALRHISREASTVLDRLLSDTPTLPLLDQLRLQEERDAVTTAFRFAGLSQSAYPRQRSAAQLTPGMPFGASFERSNIDNEDDLIAADLRRFDNNVEILELAGSMVRIYDNRLCLTVINVNRKPLEQVYGVDLVYYDHIQDTAVGVQYKKLRKVGVESSHGTSTEWVYQDRSQLVKQLELMGKESFGEVASADDWRLSSSPNFFKFIRPPDFNPNSRDLIKGMYVPDGYLRLGIEEGKFDTGPIGGFRIGYDNTRYFTSTTFIELVRQVWIGTRKTDRSGLAEKVAALAVDDEVVLAIRSERAR